MTPHTISSQENTSLASVCDLNKVHDAILRAFPNQGTMGYYHPLWEKFCDNRKTVIGGSPDGWNGHDYDMAGATQLFKALSMTVGNEKAVWLLNH